MFAGADVEATDRARSYFTGYPPSSPSIALLRDGKLLWMLERRNIENQTAEMIAKNLTDAFDRYCAPAMVRSDRCVYPPRVCISRCGFFFKLLAGTRGERSRIASRSSAPRSDRADHSVVIS